MPAPRQGSDGEARVADSLETRVARLEQRLEDTISRVDSRLIDLATEVRALSPLVIAHAEMAVKLSAVVDEAKGAHRAVESLEGRLDARDEEQRKERKADRKWLVGTVFVAGAFIVATLELLLK